MGGFLQRLFVHALEQEHQPEFPWKDCAFAGASLPRCGRNHFNGCKHIAMAISRVLDLAGQAACARLRHNHTKERLSKLRKNALFDGSIVRTIGENRTIRCTPRGSASRHA